MSKTVITITIEGGSVTVNTSGGGGGGRRSEPLAQPTGKLATNGDTSIRMPGKKGGAVCDAEDDDLAYWRAKVADGLANDPDSKFAASNRKQLEAIETEMGRRIRQGGGSSSGGDDDFPPDNFGGGGAVDDEIPFGPHTLP